MPADSTMSYEELLLFLSQTERFVSSTISIVSGWCEGADEIRKNPKYSGLPMLGDINVSDVDTIIKNRDSLLGVPTLYLIFMTTAALDAYLRSLVLPRMKHPPQGDDTWFSLDVVELVLGIRLADISSWPDVKKLYEARSILLRLDFNLLWSTEYVLSLVDKAADFAKDVKGVVSMLGADPEAAQ